MSYQTRQKKGKPPSENAPLHLDQNFSAMLRDTLTALDQLPSECARFRKQLPARAHPTLEQLEGSVRKALNPKEAYNMVPGRDPENV